DLRRERLEGVDELAADGFRGRDREHAPRLVAHRERQREHGLALEEAKLAADGVRDAGERRLDELFRRAPEPRERRVFELPAFPLGRGGDGGASVAEEREPGTRSRA